MDNPPALPSKGLGPLAWVGIGCGGLIVLVIIGVVVFSVMFGGKIKEIALEAKTNPTRAVANTALAASMGQLEMVTADDVNKRYTLREKKTDKLTTIYWSEKNKAPETVDGDFSAIPVEIETPGPPDSPPIPLPDPAPPEPVPTPAP